MKATGSMTALVTPMVGDEIDFDTLGVLVERQIDAGIEALVAVGTTGESATLNVREHVQVVKHVVEVANKRVPVIAGAGANSTSEALELSNASAEAGADGLLQVTPYYNKPTQLGLALHFETIAERIKLPIVLYNVPGRTSCDLLPETVARLAEVDNIVAIKEATGDMQRVSRLIELVGNQIAILSGDDFTTYPLLALGGHGVISVSSNVVPDRVAQMCKAAASGNLDRARQLHYSLLPLTRLLFAEPNPIPVKAALEMMGIIKPGIRLPLCPASDAVRGALEAQLRAERLL